MMPKSIYTTVQQIFINLVSLKNNMVVGENLKKIALLIILGIFIISISNAEIAISPVKNINTVGYPGSILTYQVTIYNVGTSNDTISFFGAEIVDASTGQTITQLTLSPGQSKDVIINYQIPPGFSPGSISPQISVFNSSGVQFASIQLQGTVLAIPPTYSTTQITDLLVLQNGVVGPVDPREPFDIYIIVSNPSKATVAQLSIESQFTLNYPPTVQVKNGTDTIKVSNLLIPNNTEPGNYSFTANILMPDKTKLTKTGTIVVKGYSSCDLKESSSIGIFGRTYQATVTNYGTEARTCVVESSFSNIERGLITEPTQGAEITDSKIKWTFTLNPNEGRVVKYSVNYVPLVAIPFVVILLVFTFWYLTRKIEISRELIDYKLYAGAYDLKIQIRVKNLSGQDYKEVSVKEILPSFVKEVREFGTAEGKIEKHGKGHAIVWNIKELKAHEERIFSYKIRTAVEVIGKMIFPETVVSYYDSTGKHHKEVSGPLVIEIEETKKKE